MSYPIDYSLISVPKAEFDTCYNLYINSTSSAQVQSAITRMADLSESIHNTLATAPAYVGGFFFQMGITQVKTEDKQKVIEDVQTKLSAMFSHSMKIDAPSLTGRATPVLPPRRGTPPPPPSQNTQASIPSSASKTNAVDYAVGFSNMSNNCWANAFLSMVVCVPSLKQAYETVANHYAGKNENDPTKKYGEMLIKTLLSYRTALSDKQAVPIHVSQDVRLVFHALFGKFDIITGKENFSANAWAQEDAHDALVAFMTKYVEILQSNPNPTPLSSLYCPLSTERHYASIGDQRNPKPGKTDYSRLGADNVSRMPALPDYQILLDLQNSAAVSFPNLLSNFFKNPNIIGSENAEYLLPNDKVQTFKPTEERRQFVQAPNEFILTLKRFGKDVYGNGFKITTPVAVTRMISLPPEATRENKSIAYELDSFIVHLGGIGGGHYICYKKIEGKWIEANDSNVRFVDPRVIDQILCGNTSYVHHYSRSGQAQQAAIEAAPNNTVLLSAELTAESIVIWCTQQQLEARLAIEALEVLSHNIQNDPECLKNVPSNLLNTLRHAIWLNGGVPNTNDYGTIELDKDPKKLLAIKSPWLIGKMGTTLLDQMLIIQKRKLEIASDQLNEALVKDFITKLNNPARSNEELHLAFKALPEVIRGKLQERIYLNHVERFGKDFVHKHELNRGNNYGGAVLTCGDLRKTLTEACNGSGVNIVQQLATALDMRAKTHQNAYEKEQLEAFRELLLEPTLTAKQLAKAFERLDINHEVKQKILMAIWVGHKEPKGDSNYGGNTLAANPRCLLEITQAILATPPTCPAGSNILEQMIALLDKGSRL